MRVGLAGKAGEDGNVEILRASLERLAGAFGDEDVVVWAKETLASNSGSPADRRTALNVVAAQADVATFDRLLTEAKADKDPLEKQHVFEALAGVQDPALARRMVEIAFSDDPPAGSAPALISYLSFTHPDLAWTLSLPHLEDPKLPMDVSTRWIIAGEIASRSALPERITTLQAYEENATFRWRRAGPSWALWPPYGRTKSLQLKRFRNSTSGYPMLRADLSRIAASQASSPTPVSRKISDLANHMVLRTVAMV